jgi:hypothetical protein
MQQLFANSTEIQKLLYGSWMDKFSIRLAIILDSALSLLSKLQITGWVQHPTPEIPATQRWELGGLWVHASPGKKKV